MPSYMPWADNHDYGHEEATKALEETPARNRLYTFDEVVSAMGALGSLPEGEEEWRDWIEGHVEHMAAGGYIVGRDQNGQKLREANS